MRVRVYLRVFQLATIRFYKCELFTFSFDGSLTNKQTTNTIDEEIIKRIESLIIHCFITHYYFSAPGVLLLAFIGVNPR